MGKDKKNRRKCSLRLNPLHHQIIEDRYALRKHVRCKIRGEDNIWRDEYVDHKVALRILNNAKRQREGEDFVPVYLPEEAPCPHDGEIEELDEEFSKLESYTPTPIPSDSEDVGEIPMDKNDEKALEKFMIKDGVGIPTLSDAIKDKENQKIKEMLEEKLDEKRTEILTGLTEEGYSLCNEPIDNETLHRFKQLVPVLRDYRSGKLPKAFKAIPRFCNWEQIVQATEPEKWSAATMYEATRIFSSNLGEKMAQRFNYLVLLPRIRDDIAESKKLNDHLYKALKKSLFKPAAFFKGIVLPLCHARNCTYREATIVGSLLAQFSVPVLHSCAALLAIAEMDYNGVESIFMRILLEKKYGLPHRVLNGIVDHFRRSMKDRREYPLLWHQCLLTFVQIYNDDLLPKHKEDLLKVIAVHNHKHVTPEIRKILKENGGIEGVMEHLWKLN